MPHERIRRIVETSQCLFTGGAFGQMPFDLVARRIVRRPERVVPQVLFGKAGFVHGEFTSGVRPFWSIVSEGSIVTPQIVALPKSLQRSMRRCDIRNPNLAGNAELQP